MKRSKLATALALALVLTVAAILAATAGARPDAKTGASAKSVTVLSLWGGAEKDAFLKVLAGFTKKTGIKVQYETARDFLPGDPHPGRGGEPARRRDHPAARACSPISPARARSRTSRRWA